MGIVQVLLMLLGLILILIGVIFIYDARIITKKFFGFGDQNEGTFGLKIAGLIILLIGGCIIIFL